MRPTHRQMVAGIIVRPVRPEDTAHVYKTWLDTYRESRWGRAALQALYYDCHRLVIESILRRSVVYVACSETDADTIAGWACAEPARAILHYAHVKPGLRGGGIARALVDSFDFGTPFLTCSHYPPAGGRLPDGYKFDATKMFFNPNKDATKP